MAVDAEEREHAAASEGGAEHADEARAQGVAETLAVEVDVGRQRHHGTRPAPQAGQHHHRRVHPCLQANTGTTVASHRGYNKTTNTGTTVASR